MPQDESANARTTSLLRWAFVVCVICLAIFQFSENTTDIDLWGHVLFGEQLLHTGHLARTDPYSWTANGQPWVNHETIAVSLRAPAVLADLFAEMRAAFLAATDPKQQREVLRRRITAAVGLDADRDWWVGGKTADLVIAGRIELKRVLTFMATVDRRRGLPAGEQYAIENAEAWFQRVVARLCNERKVPFAKSRIVQELPR